MHNGDADPWLAADKAQHLVACAILTLTGYAVALRCTRSRGVALLFGVLLSLFIAGFKELGDALHVRRLARSVCASIHIHEPAAATFF